MARKIKKYKVGMNSETYAISLVEEPAIESDFVALAKDDAEKMQVFLESEERHMLYGAALIPDRDIYRNNGEQEFYINFTRDSIVKMSQDFMKEYRQYEVKTDHEDVADEVCVVESWIVEDSYKDKSNALGISVPEGTWMVGMKVNNIECWDRIRQGELKGFSVESLVSLEEFSKIDNNMNIEANEMFFNRLKNVFKEVLSSLSLSKDEIEPVNDIDLSSNSGVTNDPDFAERETRLIQEELEAEPAPAEPTPAPEPAPTAEPEPVVEEPKPAEPVEEPKPAEPEPAPDNHLEELINSLKEEVEALKKLNGGLQTKIKNLEKEPSTKPVNVNAKTGVNGDAYTQWRETMRHMM